MFSIVAPLIKPHNSVFCVHVTNSWPFIQLICRKCTKFFCRVTFSDSYWQNWKWKISFYIASFIMNSHACFVFTMLNLVLSQEIKSNKTVLHLAVKEGNIQLVHFFLKLQLPDMQAFINMKVTHAKTSLYAWSIYCTSFYIYCTNKVLSMYHLFMSIFTKNQISCYSPVWKSFFSLSTQHGLGIVCDIYCSLANS